MTYLLDLSPELEVKLQVLAARRGTDTNAAVVQLVADGLRDVEAPASEGTLEVKALPVKRSGAEKKPLRGRGRYAAPGLTVDALLQERHEEAQREMVREESFGGKVAGQAVGT